MASASSARNEDVPHVMTHQVLSALDRCREFAAPTNMSKQSVQMMPGAPLGRHPARVQWSCASAGSIIAAEDLQRVTLRREQTGPRPR
jgi:hypothetical protein